MKKTLLCGIQKSGNNWGRFVIFNYYHILNHGATKTLNWDELEKPHLERYEKGIDFDGYKDGYPLIHHTHNSYDGHGLFKIYEGCSTFFDKFDILIYFYRNPYDTCISYWHFMMDREVISYPLSNETLEEMRSLKGFIKFYLPKWIHHVKTTIHRAHLVLNYDVLRRDPSDFRKAIQLITENQINEEIFQKALQLSTFDNIKKMSEDMGKIAGLGHPHYKGYFCRDGRSGQYLEIMSKELIEYIKNECKKEGLDI